LEPGTKAIPLTKGKVAIVDDADFEWLNQFKWCAAKSGNSYYPVRRCRQDGKYVTMFMHYLLCGKRADHINGNGCDNRRGNLRPATPQQNVFNQKLRVTSTSGFKGVTWNKRYGKWQAQIGHNGKNKHIGLFVNLEEAARAYDAKARELFGEFARTNFPQEESR
jgi:hypothetical protein